MIASANLKVALRGIALFSEFFFFSSRRRHTRWPRDWSSDVCSSDLGLAGLGFIADLISKPTIIGYMNGLALTILVGQLPKLFGFSVEGDGFRAELTGFVRGVADGETVAAALAVGLFGLVLILGLGRWLPRV